MSRFSFALALGLAPALARADCIDDAAARHQVNAAVLRAIGWQESRLQPAALGRNANGTIDVGAFQINSVHLTELGRYGIDREALQDGCVSAGVAAWLYRRQIVQFGDTWQAVGAYHSRTAMHAAAYANRIAATLMRWQVLPRGALPFAVAPSTSPSPLASPAPTHTRASSGTSSGMSTTHDAIALLPPAR